MKIVKSISRVLLLFVVVLLFCCKPLINKMAFHPDTEDLIPRDQLPQGVEEVFFKSEDGVKLQGYYLENNTSDKVLIYYHGNAGNIGHRLSDLQKLHALGVSVFGVGYRGFGASEGSPSEDGVYLDGAAALRYVQTQRGFALDKVVILGRSIGSTVAVNTAQNQAIAGLILVTPLESGKAHAKSSGLGMIAFVAGDAFDNLTKIKSVTSPLLVIHGDKDEVIPFHMGETIYEAAECPKQFIHIKGGRHNDISSRFRGEYWPPIQQFIDGLD